MARKKKAIANLDAHNLGLEHGISASLELNSVNQWHEIERAVGSEMLALARSKAGGDAATVEQVQQVLNVLLR
jgi:hypothetical protein